MAATPVFTDLASQAALVDADNIVTSRIAWAFAPHEQAVPDMTVRVAAGSIFQAGALSEIAAQTTATIAPPPTDPRIDRVVIDQISGAVSVVTGTEAAVPTPPDIPFGTTPIAQVELDPATTEITNDLINDERNLWSLSASLRPIVSLTGATYTYSTDDSNAVVLRSNSGAMSDLLPGSGSVPPAGWLVTIINDDAADLLALRPDTGATLDGQSAFIYIGQGQQITILSDGTNYHALAKPDRCRLGANVTLHVATGGSDTNDGLTSGTAWATIQKAWGVVRDQFDFAGRGIAVQLAAGTYTQGLAASGSVTGIANANGLAFIGDVSNPSAVVIDVTGGNVFFVGNRAALQIRGMTLKGNNAINAQSESSVAFSNLRFDACTTAHVYAESFALVIGSSYEVIGGAPNHWLALRSGLIQVANTTITITGTPAFSNNWAQATLLSSINCVGNTYSGSATGSRYAATLNSAISSGVTLPGNVAGTLTTGGQYV